MSRLPIASIRVDGGTQTRAGIDPVIAARYSTIWSEHGPSFAWVDPIVVFYDGATYWLADGFHRVDGAGVAGLTSIDADVRQGTQDDAIWFALGANKQHDSAGKPRSRADVQRAIERALRHPKGATESDRKIAAHVGTTDKTVASARARMEATAEIPQLDTRTGADGKTRKMPAPKADAVAPVATKTRAPAHEPNLFDGDDEDEDEPAAVPDVVTFAPREQPRGFGQSDLRERVLRVASAVRVFKTAIDDTFADIERTDARFVQEFSDLVQDHLLAAMDAAGARLPSNSPKRPSLSLVRGGSK